MPIFPGAHPLLCCAVYLHNPLLVCMQLGRREHECLPFFFILHSFWVSRIVPFLIFNSLIEMIIISFLFPFLPLNPSLYSSLLFQIHAFFQ